MSAYGHGRHEHGQNFLTDHKFINSIIDLVKQTSGPIIEIGPGSGALTHPMAHLGRAITAVEVDAKLAAKLTQETSSATVEVVHDDFLNFRLPPLPASLWETFPFTSPLPFFESCCMRRHGLTLYSSCSGKSLAAGPE